MGPLRTKLAWRYIHERNSLLHKVLEPKYGARLEDVGARKGGSAAWKIINDGGKYLKSIVRWNVANGSSINVFKDVWIWDKSVNRWPTFVAISGSEDLTVDKLMVDGSWNEGELQKLFGEELVKVICQVQIRLELCQDGLELIYKNSGRSLSSLATEAVTQNQDNRVYWKWIKKARLMPGVEVFWWRLYNNVITTFHFLYCRRLQNVFACPRGCSVVEDLDHVTTSCVKLKEVIHIINSWGFRIPSFESFEGCCRWVSQLSVGNIFLIKLVCNSVYLTWKARNKFIHQGNIESSMMIAVQTFPSSSGDISSGHWGVNQSFRLLNHWHPPPPDWIKVNVDASLLPSYKAGIGGVFRDSKGKFLLAFGKKCIHWDISQLELLSIQLLRGVVKEWMLSYKGIIIESNAMFLVASSKTK
ncbi:hypothetical protein M5K25_001909 [Dendrobium thyrsiflorum]|uniref:Uncharacterized protein n=1 Tax=Dendrobium thyrsiflorum TaxID=117978 RepID=A0ABD0VRP0_DENTH